MDWIEIAPSVKGSHVMSTDTMVTSVSSCPISTVQRMQVLCKVSDVSSISPVLFP